MNAKAKANPVRCDSSGNTGRSPIYTDRSEPCATARKRLSLPKPAGLVAVLILILASGLVLRLWQLSARSLWFDEAFTWRLTKFSFPEMLQRAARDNNPPLYFIPLWAWEAAFGDSVFALRSLSVIFSTLTIFGMYLF